MKQQWRQHTLVLLFFSGLIFLLHYPLVFNISAHVAGNHPTDYYHFHWNYWWIRHALTNGLPLYTTDYVMAPFTTSLAYHTLTPIWFLVWAVLEPLFGQNVAINSIMLFALLLLAYATTGWLRAEGVRWRGAVLGGVLMLATSFIIQSVEWTVLSMLGWFWLPVLMLLIKQTRKNIAVGPDNRLGLWVLLLGLCVWGIGLTDFQYFLFGSAVVLPYAVRELLFLPTWSKRLRLVGMGIAALLLGMGLLWTLGPLADLYRVERDQFVPAEEEIRFQVDFPDQYFQAQTDTYYQPGLGRYVLLMALLSGVVLLIKPSTRRNGLFWLGVMLLPLLLMGGNSVVVAGLDLSVVHQFIYDTLEGLYRYPERWMPMAMLAVAALAAHALDVLMQHPRWLMIAYSVLLVVILAESHALNPTSVQLPPTQYTFYDDMGDDDDIYTVIEVPTGFSTGELIVGDSEDFQFQYAAVTHGKRIINAHLARAPFAQIWHYRTDDPLLSWLGQRRYLDPELVEPQLRDIVPNWPLGYIILHFDHIGYLGSTNEEIVGYFNQLPDLLCPVHIEDDAMTYRSTWHPDGCPERTPPQITDGVYQIDIGSPQDWRYLGWGWHRQEAVAGISVRWTGDWLQVVAGLDRTQSELLPQAALYVDLPPASYRVVYDAQSFATDRTATLLVNGQIVGTQLVPAANLAGIVYEIPANVIGDGQHIELLLQYDAAVVPESALNETYPRQLALMITAVRFERID